MKWDWRLATLADIDDIVVLCRNNFAAEVLGIFTEDEVRFRRHVALAIVEQHYDLLHTQLIVARSEGKLLAYSWVTRRNWMTYAPEEVAEVLFAHTCLDISPRNRISLLSEMIEQWELWCKICRIPVLVSSTIRSDQGGYLKLHSRRGFTVRGSFAFKKIT